MLKYILRLLTASTSLVALLLITNSAIAATPENHSLDRFNSAPVSLNLISPSLQSNNGSDTLLQHLGCSCATCVQSSEQSDRQI